MNENKKIITSSPKKEYYKAQRRRLLPNQIRKKLTGPELSAKMADEAFTIIRSNLLFALATKEKKSVLITSAERSAGKSTTSANLAASFSKTGAKTILIDADMRLGTQHKNFHTGNQKGLSTLLATRAFLDNELSESVYKIADNFYLIPSGPVPPNPAELLASRQMSVLHEYLLDLYDYVIIDAPPVNLVADPLVLSDIVGGTLLVARHKQTRYEEFARIINILKERKIPFLGAVVGDVNRKHKCYDRNACYYNY